MSYVRVDLLTLPNCIVWRYAAVSNTLLWYIYSYILAILLLRIGAATHSGYSMPMLNCTVSSAQHNTGRQHHI
jgi:hypothetical protein